MWANPSSVSNDFHGVITAVDGNTVTVQTSVGMLIAFHAEDCSPGDARACREEVPSKRRGGAGSSMSRRTGHTR